MTIKLGWPHALIGLVILAAFAFSIFMLVRNIQKQTVVDGERQRRIEELRGEVESLTDQAEDWREMADSLRQQRDNSATALAGLKKRLAELHNTPTPTPETEDEERIVCLKYVVLLEDQLKLADQETLALRKELDLTKVALDYTLQRYELQTQRLGAAQRATRKMRRRNAWTITSVAAASVVLGFGIGRI
jgi:hypothetical protein